MFHPDVFVGALTVIYKREFCKLLFCRENELKCVSFGVV